MIIEAIGSDDIDMVHHLTRRGFACSEKELQTLEIPSERMLDYVCEHVLQDDERRYACRINYHVGRGDDAQLRTLHQRIVDSGRDMSIFEAASCRILQTSAMYGHVHILRWLITETEYDIENDARGASEAMRIARDRSHTTFADDLEEIAPTSVCLDACTT
ncbi:hypothetical protein CYMTET_35662 [Cymbomonas tetramitiformis]|uniref:Uncharacterized protein n=1 Tax=Cymbomonas tetramitiformis TaxID=36881 RepID=A0AAE0F8T8_9CHLO|nr:hypothetical protein CYMTET_35662 [Cymbomonas tetramitiformis]